jgi:hypothetical protein
MHPITTYLFFDAVIIFLNINLLQKKNGFIKSDKLFTYFQYSFIKTIFNLLLLEDNQSNYPMLQWLVNIYNHNYRFLGSKPIFDC